MEEIVKAVGFLRKNGGYSLTVAAMEGNGYVVTGFFKDIGSYGTTVSYAAYSTDLDEAQNACILALAKLVNFTNAAKPAKQQAAAVAPTGGAIISLSGLDDTAWEKAKNMVKEAGFKYDKDSKKWVGGDLSALPDWLKKRAKGASASAAPAKSFVKKPAPAPAPAEDDFAGEEASESSDLPFDDDIPF